MCECSNKPGPFEISAADKGARLGYVGMPLVLAAIDLKLSPSYGQMTHRQRRLDSLSKIIRHSENLYDVTDFVAAGTNHILQLAYITTQNFFLPNDSPPNPRTGGTGASMTGHGMTTAPHSKRTGSLTHTRATSWLDAFIRCPRAYLLISTSVDYSLAVGRLPYDNSLPALVRHIPSVGAVARLPWTIHTNSCRASLQGHHSEQRKFASRRPGSAESSTTVRTPNTEIGDRGLSSQVTSGNETISDVDDETPGESGHVDLTKQQELWQLRNPIIAPPKALVNLDFLDLGGSHVESNGDTDEFAHGVADSTPIAIMHNAQHHTLGNLFAESDMRARTVDSGLDSILFHSLFHDPLGIYGVMP